MLTQLASALDYAIRKGLIHSDSRLESCLTLRAMPSRRFGIDKMTRRRQKLNQHSMALAQGL